VHSYSYRHSVRFFKHPESLFLIRFSCHCRRQRGRGCLAIWFVGYSRVRRREAPFWVTVKRQKNVCLYSISKKRSAFLHKTVLPPFPLDNIYHTVNTSYNLYSSAFLPPSARCSLCKWFTTVGFIRRDLTVAALVQSHSSQCGILGGLDWHLTRLFPCLFLFPPANNKYDSCPCTAMWHIPDVPTVLLQLQLGSWPGSVTIINLWINDILVFHPFVSGMFHTPFVLKQVLRNSVFRSHF
jgi:hypothetical protein